MKSRDKRLLRMGELHLEIVDRMKREFSVESNVGTKSRVS